MSLCLCVADTDLEDTMPHQRLASFAPGQRQAPAVSEPWPAASVFQPGSALKTEPDLSSSTAWQAHWLELRIHALQQQQQMYESHLQQLRQQPSDQAGRHAAANTSGNLQFPNFSPSSVPFSGTASAPPAAHPSMQSSSSMAQQPAAQSQHSHKRRQPDSEQTQIGLKPRRARWPIPGLSVAELANHPFFAQTGSDAQAGPSSSAQAILQGKA